MADRRARPVRAPFRAVLRLAARALLRLTVNGLENVPPTGGVLLAMNHLGDADPLIVIAFTPREVDVIGKSEIERWPVAGPLARAYGMLSVRRGHADRAALTAALKVLRAGGALLIAPEGRESPSQALEAAKGGAAFLAAHGGVPVLPIAITGTERVYAEWRRLRRPPVTLKYGPPFVMPPGTRRRQAADLIMGRIAALLPPDYRGVYSGLALNHSPPAPGGRPAGADET